MRRGQILLVVMLIMAVVVTITLSISSRTVTEISTTTTQDESSMALQAAEAGLERYLGGVPYPVNTAEGGGGDLDGGRASYFVPASTNTVGNSSSYQSPYMLESGRHLEISEMSYMVTGASRITVCWGQDDSSNAAKVAVNLVFDQQPFVNRKQYDPANPVTWSGSVSVPNGNHDCGTSVQHDHYANINLNNNNNRNMYVPVGAVITGIKIRLIDSTIPVKVHPVAIQLSGGIVPIQGGVIESTGRSGQSVQKVRATVLKYDLPVMFEEAMFSGGAIIKN